MKSIKRGYLAIVSIFLVIVLFSYSSLAESNFEKGVTAYKEKKYEEAQALLTSAMEENPTNLAILNNLALTYFERNQKGKALAFWLKALKLDPSFEEAQQGIQFIRAKLTPNVFSVKDTDFESLRKNFLKHLSLNLLFALTAITFLVSGFQWIRHLGLVKKSSQDESTSPPVTIVSIAFSLIFVVCVATLFLKTWDQMTPRAIVIKE